MIQVFFERINTVNTACITFFAVTASFNDLYMMRDDIYPEDNAFYAVRPVAQALLILRNLINSVNLMIQTLQSENNNFNICLRFG